MIDCCTWHDRLRAGHLHQHDEARAVEDRAITLSDAGSLPHPSTRIGAGRDVPRAAGDPIDQGARDRKAKRLGSNVHRLGIHAEQHGSTEVQDHAA